MQRLSLAQVRARERIGNVCAHYLSHCGNCYFLPLVLVLVVLVIADVRFDASARVVGVGVHIGMVRVVIGGGSRLGTDTFATAEVGFGLARSRRASWRGD